MKILVVAPHPDDEVLGCGGAIAKHTHGGDEVALCIVTKAYLPDWTEEFLANRSREIEKAAAVLGITDISILDFPTVKLDTVPQRELNHSLSAQLARLRPDILYVPHHGDLNKDHRLVFEACLVAARPIGHTMRRILSYEALSETEWGFTVSQPFVPNVYVDISRTIGRKLDAMKEYQSELRQPPHPRSLRGIEALGAKRGSEIGVEFAEAFMLVRELA